MDRPIPIWTSLAFSLDKGAVSHQHAFCAYLLSNSTDGERLKTSQRTLIAMDDNDWHSPAFRQKVIAQM